MYRPQRWNQHYCVISDDNLYYAEEYEEEEEEVKKVGQTFAIDTLLLLFCHVAFLFQTVSENEFPTSFFLCYCGLKNTRHSNLQNPGSMAA